MNGNMFVVDVVVADVVVDVVAALRKVLTFTQQSSLPLRAYDDVVVVEFIG